MAVAVHSIIAAIYAGDLSTIRHYIAGIGKEEGIDKPDGCGRTFLYHALATNQPVVVQLFIEAGANPNTIVFSPDGESYESFLHFAVKESGYDAIEALLQAGADSWAEDSEKRTPYDNVTGTPVRRLFWKYDGNGYRRSYPRKRRK